MKTKTSLLIALFAAAALSAHAQTSVPTPQSVAPNYKPPQNTTNIPGTQTTYTYEAPHATTWDFYIMTGAWFFDDTKMTASHVPIAPNDYIGARIRINFDDSWYLGFGVGYNITEQLSVHVQFAYASPDYDAIFEPVDGSSPPRPIIGRADISTGDLAIRYDFMRGKFRPFVQASIGFMYIDTGIPNGPYEYWWDWYWGSYYAERRTVDRTYFTLGATAGANYYFTKNFFGQLSYTGNWANTSHNWMYNQRINVSVGWNY